MATGYTCISASVRVDIDTLFAPLTGTKRADVGYKVAGSDISNLFEPSAGGDLIGFNTNFKSGGTDIADMFKALSAGSPTPTPTPTQTPSVSLSQTPTPTPTISESQTPTPTPTITPTPSPQLPTYATFDPSSGGTYNDGDDLNIEHIGNDNGPITGRLWYYWNGSIYTSSGQTGAIYALGTGPYPGTPDDMGGGIYRYYYTIRLTNAAGSTDPQDDANFGWYVNIQT